MLNIFQYPPCYSFTWLELPYCHVVFLFCFWIFPLLPLTSSWFSDALLSVRFPFHHFFSIYCTSLYISFPFIGFGERKFSCYPLNAFFLFMTHGYMVDIVCDQHKSTWMRQKGLTQYVSFPHTIKPLNLLDGKPHNVPRTW